MRFRLALRNILFIFWMFITSLILGPVRQV